MNVKMLYKFTPNAYINLSYELCACTEGYAVTSAMATLAI